MEQSPPSAVTEATRAPRARFIAPLLVGAALGIGIGAQTVEAANTQPAATAQATASQTTPKLEFLKADNADTSCKGTRGIQVSLHGPRNVILNQKNNYKLIAKNCNSKGAPSLHDVDVVALGPNKQRKTLHVDNLKPGATEDKSIRMIFSKRSRKPFVRATAYNEQGKPLRKARWSMNYLGLTGPGSKNPVNVEPKIPEFCRPRPDFYVGIGGPELLTPPDGVSREAILQMDQDRLGVAAVRLNLVYGDIAAYGYQNVIDEINAAHHVGINKFLFTVMGSPNFADSKVSQALGFNSPDLGRMAQFAQESAAKLIPYLNSPRDASWSIWNEPNITQFLASRSITDYIALYNAGRQGIHNVDPGAEMYAGELAPTNLPLWVDTLTKSVQADGISLHPYYSAMNIADGLAKSTPLPLVGTEYANPANSPTQTFYNAQARKAMECMGFKAIYYYQTVQTPDADWNTGIASKEEVQAQQLRAWVGGY